MALLPHQKNPSHTYSGNGPYVLCLTVTDSNCISTYCDSLTVDSNGVVMKGAEGFTIHVGELKVGINEISAVKFDFYPNPVEDIINLQLTSNNTDQIVINIVNVNGQIVKSEDLNVSGNQHIQINVSTLRKGMYLLYLKSNSGVYAERFIKE